MDWRNKLGAVSGSCFIRRGIIEAYICAYRAKVDKRRFILCRIICIGDHAEFPAEVVYEVEKEISF